MKIIAWIPFCTDTGFGAIMKNCLGYWPGWIKPTKRQCADGLRDRPDGFKFKILPVYVRASKTAGRGRANNDANWSEGWRQVNITDKMRLDWLTNAAREATPGGWWSVNYDGNIIREDGAGNKDDYAGWAAPTIRAAIDAAIRASKKAGRGRVKR